MIKDYVNSESGCRITKIKIIQNKITVIAVYKGQKFVQKST